MSDISSLAAIDLGSNTLRLECAVSMQGHPPHNLKVFSRRLWIVRLGEGFDSRNNLIPSSMDRAILALKDLVSMIRDYDSSSIHFVTTGVVREAGNQKGFLDRVKQETGIEARVLNGDEEAELTLAGVRSTLSGFSLPLLVCDIGGGSTEFAMLMENGATRFFSIPMGAIRLTERFQISAPLKKSDEIELNEFIKKNLIEAFNTSERISTFVATAGTPTTLAAIDQALRIYEQQQLDKMGEQALHLAEQLEKTLRKIQACFDTAKLTNLRELQTVQSRINHQLRLLDK